LRAQWNWYTGWASMAKPAAAAAIQHEDRGARRIEGRCTPCNSRRSDVFPMALARTTGRDYTINGAALPFRPGGT
jgi:peptide methionine sulfoxide reductase MsrB